jgi:hypothetical protein
MQIIKLDDLRPAIGRAAKFEGAVNNANNSFFVVNSQPGAELISTGTLTKKYL